ncbi:MAG: acyl-protein synthetase [Acidobacteria bacterium]|nr:MAG: acyl-protein synthetase [Acidobacteriota bacterium]
MLEVLLDSKQFSLRQSEKESLLLPALNSLTRHHSQRCPEYQRILSVMHPGFSEANCLSEVPSMPISMFKTHRLRSIPEGEIFKTLTSSGTTGQQVSQVVLDRETARRQTAGLARIMSHVLGPQRLPMIVVESRSFLRNRTRFSARAAGVLGMMNFGRHHFFCLDDSMNLDEAGLSGFLAAHRPGPFLIFGFTFMVWQHLFLPCAGAGIDLSEGILVHSGGWKKLQDIAVTNEEFRRQFATRTGLTRIYNFYGTVEQVGSVFIEGDDGYLYCPNFADVVIRDPVTWDEAPVGKTGVIQILSALPLSYPGHSILTEDLGVLRGVDDGRCGRMGKYFTVIGRVPKAELRGCSDTYMGKAA